MPLAGHSATAASTIVGSTCVAANPVMERSPRRSSAIPAPLFYRRKTGHADIAPPETIDLHLHHDIGDVRKRQ
jgi:hypothetical protein